MAINTYSLVDLPSVKRFMGVTGSDTEMDDLLCELINRHSVLFETYMSRNILSRSYTETQDGGGYHMLFTTQYPIQSVSSIHDSSSWVWSDDTLIDTDDYVITSGDHLNAIILKTLVFGDYLDNVKVIYTAGYDEVPLDIQQCIIEEVVRSYNDKDELGVSIKSISDDSMHYTSQGLLEKTQQVLSKYKRLSV